MSFFRLGLVTTVLVGVASGQTVVRPPARGSMLNGRAAYAMPVATSEEVLEEMAGRAGVIFAGTVTAVRLPEEGGGVVEVEFAVSDAVRGVAGGVYVVREWAGLWRDGPRYTVGDRRLMLLHAPGPGGLSSPVDGMDGAIPVAPGGVVASAASGVGGGESVDMRWLEAKTLRGGGYGMSGGTLGTVAMASFVGSGKTQVSEARPGAPEVVAGSALEGRRPLSDVVALLTGWEARRNAGR